jgi:hypothetical protein
MSAAASTPQSPASSRFYPLLLLFFAGSGAAALIYEIVWFQLLELVIGSTAASMAVLLGTFMGGMCIGSLGFARVVPATLHPLKVYAAIEGGIGLIAILVWYRRQPIYAHWWSRFTAPCLNAPVRDVPAGPDGAHGHPAVRGLRRARPKVSWLGIFIPAIRCCCWLPAGGVLPPAVI